MPHVQRVLPQGIDKQELVWHMGIGEGRNWSWVSELKYRKFRQRETVWRDSLRGWLHTHRAQMTNWRGWIFSGSYTHGEIQIGRERQQTTHLGRVRLGHNRPGASHQINVSRFEYAGQSAHFCRGGARAWGIYLGGCQWRWFARCGRVCTRCRWRLCAGL